MLEQEIRQKIFSHALIIEKTTLEELTKQDNTLLDQVIKHAKEKNSFIISSSLVHEVVEGIFSNKKAEETVIEKLNEFNARAAQMPSLLIAPPQMTEKKCLGKVEDFTNYFRDKFKKVGTVLRQRSSQNGFLTTRALRESANSGKNARLIAMVYDKQETKNGHVLLELEDEEGSVKVLVPKDSSIKQNALALINDEVIAIDGYLAKELFIAKNISYPEVEYRKKKIGSQDTYIAFLSDLHVGSKYFMEEQFQKFLKFLNGEGSEEEREFAGAIKYILIAGDLVDGIGVYPTQEKQLITKDIYEQYRIFREAMKQIPQHIQVVIMPGNHDAVRTAEPQPRLLREFTAELEEQKNMHFVPNPAWLEIDGLRILMYHGTSSDSIIANLNIKDGYSHPEKVAVEMLKRRHLAPVYGDKPLMPVDEDQMVIHASPDIFHFGHVHKNAYLEYRGTTVINSGTWQNTTDYQLKQGHVPTPCQLPLYHLKTGALKILNFNTQTQAEGVKAIAATTTT